jgi:hypothetical protein
MAHHSLIFGSDAMFFISASMSFKYIGTDIEADMKNMASLPKMREWWAMTDEMQVCVKHFLQGLPPPWTLSTAHGSGNRALLVPGYSD